MIRIVKLTIDPAKAGEFEALFEQRIGLIRNFPGCSHLELWKGQQEPGSVYFTYSIWESTAALDVYRHSDFFADTWSILKKWFAGKPEAWSMEEQMMVAP